MSDAGGEVTCHGGVPWRLVGVIGRGRFRRTQILEDAIAYRQARATWPCAGCSAAPPGRKCDDHARDLGLIASYRHELRLASLPLGPLCPRAGGPAPDSAPDG
jgi:hypothetical protein